MQGSNRKRLRSGEAPNPKRSQTSRWSWSRAPSTCVMWPRTVAAVYLVLPRVEMVGSFGRASALKGTYLSLSSRPEGFASAVASGVGGGASRCCDSVVGVTLAAVSLGV